MFVNNAVNEYCTGVSSPDNTQQCLHMAMFYRPNNHSTSAPSPSPPPIEYTTNPSPSFPSASSSSSSPRITLPPLSTILSSMGSAPSSPPPPYSALPPSTPTPRFPIYHTRYYGSLDDKADSSQDHHKLFIFTQLSNDSDDDEDDDRDPRGIYLHVTGTSRRGLRYTVTPGDIPKHTPALRECTLLGSISANDLDELQDVARLAHVETFPVPAKGSTVRRKSLPASCGDSFRVYTLSSPPPPYSPRDTTNVSVALPLTSPSQEWVAAVIDMAQTRGLLWRC